MATVKAESTFGNSKWQGHAEVSDVQRDVLADLGFLWVMQRSPSSNAEKALAGYEKRPNGFKRSDIPWSDEMGAKLKSLLGGKITIGEVPDKDGKLVEVSITAVIDSVKFHEIGAGVEPKYADEKKIIQRHIDAGDVRDWAAGTIGIDTRDLTIENVEFLKAVKAYKQRMLAGV